MKYTGKKDNEVFVGNTTLTSPLDHLSSLQTLRLGDVALDIDGKQLPGNYRPIFIDRSEEEAYNRIATARFSAIRS